MLAKPPANCFMKTLFYNNIFLLSSPGLCMCLKDAFSAGYYGSGEGWGELCLCVCVCLCVCILRVSSMFWRTEWSVCVCVCTCVCILRLSVRSLQREIFREENSICLT